MSDKPLTLNGVKTLELEAAEVASVLDALAVQSYNRVANLIAKIVNQARDVSPDPAGE